MFFFVVVVFLSSVLRFSWIVLFLCFLLVFLLLVGKCFYLCFRPRTSHFCPKKKKMSAAGWSGGLEPCIDLQGSDTFLWGITESLIEAEWPSTLIFNFHIFWRVLELLWTATLSTTGGVGWIETSVSCALGIYSHVQTEVCVMSREDVSYWRPVWLPPEVGCCPSWTLLLVKGSRTRAKKLVHSEKWWGCLSLEKGLAGRHPLSGSAVIGLDCWPNLWK